MTSFQPSEKSTLAPSSQNLLALVECPLLHGNIQKETDTEKSIYYDFMRFGDSSKVCNPMKQ